TWGIEEDPGHAKDLYFIKHLYQPFDTTYDYELTSLIYEVRFPADAINPLLNQLKTDAESDPFLYIPGYQPIVTSTANDNLIRTLLDSAQINGPEGSFALQLDVQQYLVSYVQ